MPATIIGSTEWNQRGLVLTQQSAAEDKTGLVTVSATYAGPSSKHDAILRQFYREAPPPIWPSVVSKDDLLTRRLYLDTLTVNRANGITEVQASYVGGVAARGGKFFIDETKESPINGLALNYGQASGVISQYYTGLFMQKTDVANSPEIPVRLVGLFRVTPVVKRLRFVRVAGQQAANLPSFTRADVARLEDTASPEVVFATYWARSFQTVTINTFSLTPTEGNPDATTTISRNVYRVPNYYTKDTVAPYTESYESVTENVQIVTRSFTFA